MVKIMPLCTENGGRGYILKVALATVQYHGLVCLATCQYNTGQELDTGFIRVRENWKSQFENYWVENRNSTHNRLFFEAEKKVTQICSSGDDRGALIIIQSSYCNCLK